MSIPAPAQAQFSLVNASAQTVMSSRDLNALLDAIAFDAAQRASAGPMFDDAQVELIAARDDLAATTPPGHGADAKELADHQTRLRRAYERMKAAEGVFFEKLAAIARADQAALVERERLAAARRLIRRSMSGGQGTQGPVRVDLIASVLDSKLPPEDQAKALAALVGYQTQLTTLLGQALDEGMEVDAKAAKLREKSSGNAPTVVEGFDGPGIGIQLNDPVRRQASESFDAVLDKISALHQQAMLAMEGALSPIAADSINAAAAKRIWPRAAMDGRSPRAAFAQLRGEIAKGKRPQEQLATLDSAQPAWLAAWWSSTRKACESENALRRFGLIGGVRNDDYRAARDAMRAAQDARESANQAAWRALAAIDTEHADFYAPFTSPPDTSNRQMFFAGGHEPTPPSKGGGAEGAPGGAHEVAGAMVIMSTATSIDGEEGGIEEETIEMPFVFEAGSPDAPIAITMGPDGVATLSTDTLGDGMNGPGLGIMFDTGPGIGSQLTGARMPTPLNREKAAEFVRALSDTPAPDAAVDQLYTNYSERIKALDDTTGAEVRNLLSGPPAGVTMRIRGDDGSDEAPAPRTTEEIRSGVAKLDAYTTQMAGIDDQFVADLAAACAKPGTEAAAQKAAIALLCEERARERLRQLRYPSSPMLNGPGQGAPNQFDLASIVRQAELSGADKRVSAEVLAEWSPAALAAMEQARASLRNLATDLLEAERKLFSQVREVDNSGGGKSDRQRVETRSNGSPEEFQAHQALIERGMRARDAGADLTRDARQRLDAQLSEAGRSALLKSWCRAVAPQAYTDRKNAEGALSKAADLPDLTPDQKSQIAALQAAHAAAHAELTEKIGVAAADAATAPSPDGPQAFGPRGGANPQLERLRFDRSELNERTLRRLKTVLTTEQAERLKPSGSTPVKVRTVQGQP